MLVEPSLHPMPFQRNSSEPLGAPLKEAIDRASQYLLSVQDPSGYWVGELEADSSLESDTVKFWHLIGRVDRQREKRLVRTILKNQLPDGGWPIYAGGPSEINATVKGYLALRLAGFSAEDPILKKAKETILRLGGLERINSFEKIYLALFGCYPWSQVPALPPELLLLPNWFPFNIYEIAYWSRTILIPLAVVYATRPIIQECHVTLDELWIDPARKKAAITNFQKGGVFWRSFFLGVNFLLKMHEAFPWKPWRQKALRTADRWMSDRLVETDGLGAIYPAMINAVFALKGLGYEDGDPLYERSIHGVERLELADGEGLKLQPCFSAIWDTALSLYILGKSKKEEVHSALDRARDWLLSQEIRQWGDWAVKNPKAKPGGWAFEFRNPFYPDVDDAAQVVLGFYEKARGEGHAETALRGGAFRRGIEWILSMQNKDGGWSSFDKNNNCQPLTHFPFADHNAMLDPSACDITGRILELLSSAGFTQRDLPVRRAVAFLKRHQESDGTWLGRWGVNYIYGTWLALRGLKAVGEQMEEARYQRAAEWLLRHQNSDGGWGESCRSYDDPSTKGQGESTASQTAWALMALMSLNRTQAPAFETGLNYLLRTQQSDGNWKEGPWTGTGFPRVFYLKYHLYRTYFPLLALIEFQEMLSGVSSPEGARREAY